MCRFFISLIVLCCSIVAHAQSVLDVKVGSIKEGQPLSAFLKEFEQQQKVKFFYVESWLEPYSLRRDQEGSTLREVLTSMLMGSDIGFSFMFDYAVIFFKDPTRESTREALIKAAQVERKAVGVVVIGDRKQFKPGSNVTLSGTVRDDEKHTPLTPATVYITELDRVVTTDGSGRYSVSLPGGEYLVSFRFVNRQEKLVNLAIYQDGEVNVELGEIPITLEEVLISDQRVATRRVGETTIKMIEVKRAPSFLGQVDVIKQVQMQSGVTTVSEASSGFNVRGGGADQNLILFDGVPIFNTAHALGFFTAFNADAINEVSFYKGGIPAEFGGRVSSVLNMNTKDGNYEKWTGVGGIGLVSSNLTVGGPIKKDTSSLVISLRSSYSDWMLNLLKTRYQNINNGSVFFYDGSLKYSHKLDNRSKISFTAYTSHDRFSLANDTINQWRNITAALRYDHSVSNNLFYNVGLYMGNYHYEVTDPAPLKAFKLNYDIIYPALKIDINHVGPRHSQSFGFHSTYYLFHPGELKPMTPESNVKQTIMPAERGIESALYFGDAYNVSSDFLVEAGLRLSMYNRIGPGTVYLYQPNAPREPENITDSLKYGSGQIMKTYIGPEPRLSVRYSLNSQSSLKLGFNRMYQYVHLISNTATITPVDIWQLSNTYFRPQIADQISAGYFRDSRSGSFEYFVEAYYKRLQNILDFKDGANLILNPQLETALLPGTGKAYGIEFSIQKKTGRLVGAFNYTYSRSLRHVDGTHDIEKINGGNTYPANYDQPNIVNLNWRYKITRRIFLTGAFTYHTGRPVSLPESAYVVGNVPVSNFVARNNYRIPDYHRLDLALLIEGSNKKKKRVEGTWVFSIYNVYGRKNPYSVFFVDQGGGVLKPYQLSLIGTAVPSITYSFKF